MTERQRLLLCGICETRWATEQCARCHHKQYCGAECQKRDWKRHKRSCYALPQALYADAGNVALHEALRLNLFEEYQALQSGRPALSAYDEARYWLYSGVVRMILFDPVAADHRADMQPADWAEWNGASDDVRRFHALMKQAAPQRVWDAGDLHWAFVPRRLHRDIEYMCGVA